MKYIQKAITNLLSKHTPWRMNGDPVNEQDFLSMFEIVTGVNETHQAIYSTNQSDFGVTWNQIQEEVARLKELEITEAYKAKRQAEYPLLADLADALYHQSKGDETKLTAYLAKCEAVKTKYPKST